MEPLDIAPLDMAPDVDPDIEPLEPDWASAGAAMLVANKASTASFVIFFIALSCLGPRVSPRGWSFHHLEQGIVGHRLDFQSRIGDHVSHGQETKPQIKIIPVALKAVIVSGPHHHAFSHDRAMGGESAPVVDLMRDFLSEEVPRPPAINRGSRIRVNPPAIDADDLLA